MRVIEDLPTTENLCCCFHPSNNNFIAVGNNRGILQIYNVSTGKPMKVNVFLYSNDRNLTIFQLELCNQMLRTFNVCRI